MPAGDIQDPSKVRTELIQGTASEVDAALLVFLQARTVGTTIHSMNTVRANNSQGLIVLIAYEIP
jgi:hypothetical protein